MMFTLLRDVIVVRRCLIRSISEFTSSTSNSEQSQTFSQIGTFNEDNFISGGKCKRFLKVAILGTPNSGKSTLINQLIGRPVLCVSKKAHTTRKKARAAVVRDNVQILFVDTPGLVSHQAVKRHHLDRSFVEDGIRAVKESSIVGVMHDVSNKWTRNQLDPKILDILNAMETDKKSFLVLNKVDLIRKKDILLNTVKTLTTAGPTEVTREEEVLVQGENGIIKKPEKRKKIIPYGFQNFQEVFLVSALSGDGVNHILSYLVKEAKDGKWPLPPGHITDQKTHNILEELIRGRILDALPKEVPYYINIETEYFHVNELGEIIAVVLVLCPSERHSKMLLGRGGRIIKNVAISAEKDASVALNTHVRLRVVVNDKDSEERRKSSLHRFGR